MQNDWNSLLNSTFYFRFLKEIMSKASSSDWVVRLIMAVIIFLFITSILWVAGKNVLIQIGEMLGIIQKSDVEKAILCSIYRCTEGCMSMKVQELSWKEGDKTVSCNDFCNASKIKSSDPQMRVCFIDVDGWKLLEILQAYLSGNPEVVVSTIGSSITDYPVEIKLDKAQKIDKSHLTLGSTDYKDVGCILSSKSEGPTILDVLKWLMLGGLPWQQLLNLGKTLTGGKVSDNFLIVSSDLVSGVGTKEDCYSEALGITLFHDAYQQLMIGSSDSKTKTKVKIYTSKSGFLFYPIIVTQVIKG